MTDDIEACLAVVIKALRRCDLPPSEIGQWCSEMQAADRVGFVAEEELKALRVHVEAGGKK